MDLSAVLLGAGGAGHIRILPIGKMEEESAVTDGGSVLFQQGQHRIFLLDKMKNLPETILPVFLWLQGGVSKRRKMTAETRKNPGLKQFPKSGVSSWLSANS